MAKPPLNYTTTIAAKRTVGEQEGDDAT